MGTHKTSQEVLIDKLLKADSYSKIFTAIYTMASLMGTIYPPPDLLFSGKQAVPVEGLNRIESAGTGSAMANAYAQQAKA